MDLSEGIDVSKTSPLNECDICHYWYFLDKEFKFQPYSSNGCQDVLAMSINRSDITVLDINGVT